MQFDYVIYFLALYDVDTIFNRRKISNIEKIMCYIRLVLELYGLLFVQGSRAYLAGFIFATLVMLFFHNGNKKKGLVRNSFIILSIILIVLSTDILDSFVGNIMSTSGDLAYSRTNRLGAISYFWSCFINNPVFGIGFLSDVNTNYLSILKGPMRTFNFTDVGIFGVIAQMGIFGLLIYMLIIIRGIKTLDVIKKRGLQSQYTVVYGMFAFLVSTMFTLSILDNFRAIIIPFYITFFEFTKYKILSTKGEVDGRKKDK